MPINLYSYTHQTFEPFLNALVGCPLFHEILHRKSVPLLYWPQILLVRSRSDCANSIQMTDMSNCINFDNKKYALDMHCLSNCIKVLLPQLCASTSFEYDRYVRV